MFDIAHFEATAHDNGVRYWLAHDFMVTLGYETWPSFKIVIQKAMGVCLQLGIDADEAFTPLVVEAGVKSYKLTRFACFLVAMQADARKPEVATAQIALAAIADALIEEKIAGTGLARLEERSKLTMAERQLGGTAKEAGLEPGAAYAVFRDYGFRGLYNMPLKQLQLYKGAPSGKTLYDFMGLTELAANTFRVTQTAERMKRNGITGLSRAKATAQQVGQEVRGVMLASGVVPENLPLEGHINQVKKQIKTAHRKMKKLDTPAK